MRELWPHQVDGLNMLRWSLSEGRRRPMLQSPTGCHAAGTQILMADGSTKLVDHIDVGDDIMGPDSTPRRVLDLHQGRDEMVDIVPIKGDTFRVNRGHVLSLIRTNDGSNTQGAIIDISVDAYLAQNSTFRHVHKLFRVPVTFLDRAPPVIDPYFLGVLLGDGCLCHGSVTVTTPDAEIVEELHRNCAAPGLTVRTNQVENSEANNYALVTPRGQPNPLLQHLGALGLRVHSTKKFLPESYRLGSRATRLAILAGLLDTDGHLLAKCFEFVSASRRLAEDVAFVARSLGLRACLREKLVDDVSYWRMFISGDTSIIPTRVVRKQASPRRQIKDVLRTGFTVHPVGMGDYFGFQLDGDHRYVMGDFTVTHNSGKTLLSAAIVKGALQKSKRMVFVVPAVSLINQTVKAFYDEGITEVGVIQASHPMTNRNRPVQIASVQTLGRRSRPEADLFVIDEAHILHQTHRDLLTCEALKNIPIIGLSATPWRKGLGKFYDDLLVVTTTQRLIDDGFLSPFRVFAPNHPDLSGVKTVAGDYNESDLADVMDTPPLVADVVQNWVQHGENRPTLCFAVDRAHAKHLQESFLSADVPTGYIDCNVDGDAREPIFEQFRRGEIKVICNVATMTTGVDLDVRCLILARPTKSESLFVQIIGRALRTAPGKDHAIIFDHSDSHLRLGFVTDIHHDELDDGSAGEKAKPRARPLPKECPSCHFLRPAKVSKCPSCGFKPEVQNSVDVEEGQLVAFEHKRARDTNERKASVYGQLQTIAKRHSYSRGWASHKYREYFGAWPDAVSWAPQREPESDVLNWVRSRQIAFAKSKRSA